MACGLLWVISKRPALMGRERWSLVAKDGQVRLWLVAVCGLLL